MFQSIKDDLNKGLRPGHSEIRPTDWEVLSKYWYPVGRLEDVKDQPVPVTLLDVQLVVFRSNEGFSVVLDRCPHRWVKLSAGAVVNGNIECSYHALQFSGAGQCVHIPGALKAAGSAQAPGAYRVEAFPVQEKFGLVWTCLDDSSKYGLPEFPGLDSCKLLYNEPRGVPCSAHRQIENFFDMGHLPTVHQPSLGGDVNKQITPGEVSSLGDGVLQMVAHYDEIPMGEGIRPVKYTHRITLPFVADLTISDEHGDARFINVATPVSAYECLAYQILLDSTGASEHHANVIGATNQINDEDKYILQNTPPVGIRLDGRGEIHMAIDNMSITYRKNLLALGLGQ